MCARMACGEKRYPYTSGVSLEMGCTILIFIWEGRML